MQSAELRCRLLGSIQRKIQSYRKKVTKIIFYGILVTNDGHKGQKRKLEKLEQIWICMFKQSQLEHTYTLQESNRTDKKKDTRKKLLYNAECIVKMLTNETRLEKNIRTIKKLLKSFDKVKYLLKMDINDANEK